MTVTEETMTDAVAAGIVGLGSMAVLIGIILLVATVHFAMRGMTPAATICGFGLITLVSPVWGLVIAIIALIFMSIKGNPYIGFQAVVGWLLGLLVLVIMGVALVAIGVVTA